MIAIHTTADNYFRALFDVGHHGDARDESLTDFYEFRLYRDGQRLARAVAGQSFVPGSLKAPSPVRDADALADLFGQFLSFSLPRRFTARTLAVELAKRTRFLRDEVVALELREEEKRGHGISWDSTPRSSRS